MFGWGRLTPEQSAALSNANAQWAIADAQERRTEIQERAEQRRIDKEQRKLKEKMRPIREAAAKARYEAMEAGHYANCPGSNYTTLQRITPFGEFELFWKRSVKLEDDTIGDIILDGLREMVIEGR